MRKALFILPLAVTFLAGCATAVSVDADEVPMGTRIQNLLKSYVDENGQYTKKTTICLNEDAHKELDQYFHCGQVQAQRTTYYDDKTEQLLMAEPDGTLDSSYGGYRFVKDEGVETGKIYRFQSNDTTTLKNMFDGEHITQQAAASYKNRNHLNDVYVNLAKLTVDGYFGDGDWSYSNEYKQYTHDIVTSSQDGVTENDDRYYPDILGFAAPMLKSSYVGSNYIHIQSIGIAERYDANDTKYLSIRIYLKDADSGKVTGERGNTTMSEARIYKGIKSVGEEKLEKRYYLGATISGVYSTHKMTVNPANANEYCAFGLNLKKGDTLKVYYLDDVGNQVWPATGASSYEHVWTNSSVSVNGSNDYVVQASNDCYNVYYKVNEKSTYVTVEQQKVYFHPSNDWVSSNAKMAVYFFDSSVSPKKEQWKFMDKSGDTYSFVVPTEYICKNFVICRMNSDTTEATLGWGKKWNQSVDLVHNINNDLTMPDWWDSWTPNAITK